MAETQSGQAAGLDVTLVRAAGGLVSRIGDAGDLQVLLVHRSRYNDWSFPKGKLDDGESFEDAARREVTEETGLICRLDEELAPVRYFDSAGRPKLVRYWRMIPIEGDIRDFVFNAEIDDLRWVGVDEADSLLSYQHDRELLRPWREAGFEPRQSLKPPVGAGESDGSGS